MTRRFAFILSFAVWIALPAEKYSGPRPPKPDVPYLLHATKLVELDSVEAKEEKVKNGTAYVVQGTPAKTPLAEPIFLIEAKKLIPEKLELYRLEKKNGRMEIVFPEKRGNKGPKPIRTTYRQLAPGLFRLEANETLENGSYSLTPAGSNTVFLFDVY